MFNLCFHYTGLIGITTVSSASGSIHPNGSHREPCDKQNRVCRTQRMEVNLYATAASSPQTSPLLTRILNINTDAKSAGSGTFGIELASIGQNIYHDDPCTSTTVNVSPLIISAIEPNSPADRCGVLQVGDRIHTINGWRTNNSTVEEAHYMLRQAMSAKSVRLNVEFDVLELPLLPSNLFVVKLAKRGANYGIVCRSETNGVKGEPVIVSDIRTGSVAHRCGSIEIGDRLLAINDTLLDTLTVEESMKMLQQSSSVVKLCVAKGTQHHQRKVAQNSITYSVELQRKNQPLGITVTVAPTLDPANNSAVVISQIAENGLVGKTGALHVGDRILAINDVSLVGKNLSHAVFLLQRATDVIRLKIQRSNLPSTQPDAYAGQGCYSDCLTGACYAVDDSPPIPHNHNGATMDSMSEDSDKLETPLKSIDSAVDSLDDVDMLNGQKVMEGTHGNGLHLSQYQHDVLSTTSEPDGNVGGPTNSAPCDSGLSSATDSHQFITVRKFTKPVSGDLPDGCGRSSSSGMVSSPSFSLRGRPGPPIRSITSSQSETPAEFKENWVRILEALETVGEAEMLLKLEECIMSGGISNISQIHSRTAKSNQRATGSGSNTRVLQSHNDGILDRAIATAAIDATALNRSGYKSSVSIPRKKSPYQRNVEEESKPVPPPRLTTGPQNEHSGSEGSFIRLTGDRSSSLTPSFRQYSALCRENNQKADDRNGHSAESNILELPPPMFPLMSSNTTFAADLSKSASGTIIPSNDDSRHHRRQDFSSARQSEKDVAEGIHEIFNVSLDKDFKTKSFGFSISDGNTPNSGIYVNSVIRGSPADGKIRPMDRVLQINGTSVQFLDCDLALPLLATDRVDMLLLRKPPT